MQLEQKYEALLREAQKREVGDVAGIRSCFQILSLASAIDRDCAARLAPHGLSEGRFVVLFLLEGSPEGLAPNVLAQEAGVTRATITGLLDGLERDALISREADENDRRAMRVRLTRQGRQLARKVFAEHGRWIGGLLGGLSLAERKQLGTLLTKVAASLSGMPR